MDFFKPGQVSNSRAFVCYSLGVVFGLVMGGIGLFNARTTVTSKVPEEMVALVNQQPILRTDFEAQLEAETGLSVEAASQEDRLRVLDEMLREELFVQRGLELNFAETDQDTRYALYAIVEAQILAGIATAQPTEAQLREYFESHRDQFSSTGRIDVHHLVMDGSDSDGAEEAAKALRDGLPLEEVKQRYGAQETEYFADEYYYMSNYHLGDELFSQVTTLEAGQVLGPVPSDGSFHILQVVSNTRPEPLSFEEAGSTVKTEFYNYEKAGRMNSMLAFLRERSNILITDEYRDIYDPADFQEK